MNKDMKVFFAAKVRGEEANGDVMRNALSLIAKEIQRFRHEYKAKEDDDDVQIFKTLNTWSTKINTKNRELKKLKENLKTACNVARILLSDKNKETELLANHVHCFRNQSSDLSKDNAQHLSLIQQLKMENFKINNDVQLLYNFIHLGYEKLQQMGHEIPKNVPFIVELKTILLACGQYYADYCNEREQTARLERQNRFLKNKITILERNLAASTEELRNLRNQNVRLRVKCNLNQRHAEVKKLNGSETFPVKRYKSDEFVIANSYKATIAKTVKYPRETSDKTSYLSLHLDTVRNLLSDQNKMLQELKDLQEEFLTSDK